MCVGLFGDVLTCHLEGDDRMDLEVDLRYGVNKIMKLHWNRLNFFFLHILYLYTFILLENSKHFIFHTTYTRGLSVYMEN